MTNGAPKTQRDDRRTASVSLPETYSGQQLVVSNELVAANYRLSLTQLRLVWMFGTLIRKADEDFRHYKVSINEVIKYLDLSTRSGKVYEQIEEAVEGLLGNVLHVPARDGSGWLKFAWVASAEYNGDEGMIEFEFSDKLKPFLLRLTGNFTVAEMNQLMQLRSVYSARIYLLLKQYRKIGRLTVELDRLRLMLSIDVVGADAGDAPYRRYQDFRRYVLEHAQKELVDKTDLSFRFRPIKKGRKIGGIEITITGSRDASLNSPPLVEQSSPIIQELVNAGFTEPHAQRVRKQGWSNVASDIRDELDTDVGFDDYVRDKLSLLREARKRGGIENPTGWLVTAIRENWTDKPSSRLRVRRSAEPTGLVSTAELLKNHRYRDDYGDDNSQETSS